MTAQTSRKCGADSLRKVKIIGALIGVLYMPFGFYFMVSSFEAHSGNGFNVVCLACQYSFSNRVESDKRSHRGRVMEREETAVLPEQFIRIATPSKEDVAYVKELYKKGTVKKEDLQPNMSFIAPYHGPEGERE